MLSEHCGVLHKNAELPCDRDGGEETGKGEAEEVSEQFISPLETAEPDPFRKMGAIPGSGYVA